MPSIVVFGMFCYLYSMKGIRNCLVVRRMLVVFLLVLFSFIFAFYVCSLCVSCPYFVDLFVDMCSYFSVLVT
jgi:hypothetical protein